jgi:REP element-mobilizing transposase RayT
MLAPRNQLVIEKILTKWATKFGVTLHHRQNVGNHLHIVASFARPEEFQNFLRTITSLIARHVTGAKRGKPFGRRFWQGLAFTRVIMGQRDFNGVRNYVEKNRMEAEIHPLARKTVELHERAEREARRRRCDVWQILENQTGREW